MKKFNTQPHSETLESDENFNNVTVYSWEFRGYSVRAIETSPEVFECEVHNLDVEGFSPDLFEGCDFNEVNWIVETASEKLLEEAIEDFCIDDTDYDYYMLSLDDISVAMN